MTRSSRWWSAARNVIALDRRSPEANHVERIDPAASFSTPFDAPLVPPFPFQFRNVVILTVLYRTRMEAVRRILPPPLEVVDDLVIVHVYQMNDTDHFGSYNE